MFELKVQIPVGFQLVGTRTKGDSVIIVFAPQMKREKPEPEKPHRIGFIQETKKEE